MIMKEETRMIRLRNEGPVRPAPLLEGQAQRVSTELQSWPGIISATHWQLGNPAIVDGAEFHVKDGGELGHIHLNGEIHLALTRTLRDLLVELNLAKPFVYDKAWITAPIKLASEVDQAIWLFKLGYDRLCSTSESVLSTRIRERTHLNN
jgi:hypothetical protein